MKWFLSNIGYALWCALDHPEHWEPRGDCCWIYKNRIEMWCGNGAMFYDIHNRSGSLGWFERRIIWKKHKRMVQTKLVGEFTKALFE